MHFIILDANNLLCRSYFVADKVYTATNKPIGAICALTTYINSLINNLAPTHIALTRDLGSNTWRHKTYPQYKKNRTKADEELYLQFPLLKPLAEYLEIPLLDHENFEADDCIATLAEQGKQHAHVTIVSTDKDLCQLLDHRVRIFTPHSKTFIEEKHIMEKYGVPVEKLTEYFAIVGDACDNLPGIKGIGPKTALQILDTCKEISKIPNHIHSFTPAIQRKLHNQEENIKLMQDLVTLHRDIPLTTPFSEKTCDMFKLTKYKDTRIDTLKKLFQ